MLIYFQIQYGWLASPVNRDRVDPIRALSLSNDAQFADERGWGRKYLNLRIRCKQLQIFHRFIIFNNSTQLYSENIFIYLLARYSNLYSAEADEVAVLNLPGDFEPLRCAPPLCNPFIHTFGLGVDVNPNLNPYVRGGFDFPIPLDSIGSNVRFPLSGGFTSG